MDLRHLAHVAEGPVGRWLRDDHAGVASGEAHASAAMLVNLPDNALVDRAREHHLRDLERLVICDPEAIHELRLDSEAGHHGGDLRPAAVDHYRPHADGIHEHDIPHDLGAEILTRHGVPTELDDHRPPVVLANVG